MQASQAMVKWRLSDHTIKEPIYTYYALSQCCLFEKKNLFL